MYSYGPSHMAVQKQDDQHEHTFSNYVRIRDVVQKTCQSRWTIGESGERGSGISVLSARHDDDEGWFAFKQRLQILLLDDHTLPFHIRMNLGIIVTMRLLHTLQGFKSEVSAMNAVDCYSQSILLLREPYLSPGDGKVGTPLSSPLMG